jgi:hypothetical protein
LIERASLNVEVGTRPASRHQRNNRTVRLEPEARGARRMKLVANAWTVGLVESLRARLSRSARWAF